MRFSDSLIQLLKDGGCAVIPTDTIYGIVASALKQEAVERVYAIKGRSPQKPCIILIDRAERMCDFGVDKSYIEKLVSYATDGPTSFIAPTVRDDLEYLHRRTHTLAFRIPKPDALRELLLETGPLIAPSANPEGLPPATTIEEAQAYFGTSVGEYQDGGILQRPPSSLINLRTGERLR
jgi:L-threonylcarbamoyladenylate synthase